MAKISTDTVIIFAFKGEKAPKLLSSFKKFDNKLQLNVEKAIETASFTAKRGEILNFYLGEDSLAKSIIVLGLGKKDEFTINDLRMAVGSFSLKMKGKIDSVALEIPSEEELTIAQKISAKAIAEGLILGNYEFVKYRTQKEENRKLSSVIISGLVSNSVKEGIEKAKIYAEATILARDLVNEQAAVATPSFLSEFAQSVAKKDAKHISCKVFGRKEVEKLGMEAFLGVAKASGLEPKFIVLEYKPDKISKSQLRQGSAGREEKLAIVGKGITFDTGGINVKTGDHMQDMKMDMAGAAVVLGVFSVISKIKPNFSVLGIIAATPNMISGSSLVPGDVVRAMNGKTIEVLDTDAEGRVTMADSLSYAVNQKATRIIDFATLTGACMVALGADISGLFSNSRDFSEEIKKAAFEAGEKVWELPLEKDYREINKSEVADIANIPNTRHGGAITAALFLEEFIGNTPWAHLDIAGPAFLSKSNDLGPKGGTGHGVRTVLNLLS